MRSRLGRRLRRVSAAQDRDRFVEPPGLEELERPSCRSRAAPPASRDGRKRRRSAFSRGAAFARLGATPGSRGPAGRGERRGARRSPRASPRPRPSCSSACGCLAAQRRAARVQLRHRFVRLAEDRAHRPRRAGAPRSAAGPSGALPRRVEVGVRGRGQRVAALVGAARGRAARGRRACVALDVRVLEQRLSASAAVPGRAGAGRRRGGPGRRRRGRGSAAICQQAGATPARLRSRGRRGASCSSVSPASSGGLDPVRVQCSRAAPARARRRRRKTEARQSDGEGAHGQREPAE